jgi:hypothetical protein
METVKRARVDIFLVAVPGSSPGQALIEVFVQEEAFVCIDPVR